MTENDRPLPPNYPQQVVEAIRKLDLVEEVLEQAYEFMQRSEEKGSIDLYAYLEGAQENIHEVREWAQSIIAPLPPPQARRTQHCADNDPHKDCPCGGVRRTSSCIFPEDAEFRAWAKSKGISEDVSHWDVAKAAWIARGDALLAESAPQEAGALAPSVEDLQLAKALHINYCEDLSGEGQAWEVPAEDEPEYFATLAEAIVFLHELPDKESDNAISQLAQVCNELKDEIKLLRAERGVPLEETKNG